MKNKSALSSQFIFTQYSDYLLSAGERPKNVYLFMKENKFEEKEFYRFFSSFDQLEREILNHFFTKSVELVIDKTQKDAVSAKEKLLNLYFVFFENLTMNRSLVLTILGESKLQNLKILEALRKSFFDFIDTLNFKDVEIIEKANQDIQKINQKSRQGALWLHLLSVIEFWRTDKSPDFEKTDIFIEKTIDTGFELLDNEPLRKVIDLGKFLWKEKIKMGS